MEKVFFSERKTQESENYCAAYCLQTFFLKKLRKEILSQLFFFVSNVTIYDNQKHRL